MSRPIYEPTLPRTDAQLGYGTRQLFRRPLKRPVATLHIKVFPDEELDVDLPVVTGNGKFIFAIAEDMGGLNLTVVEAFVTTVSSSGIVQVQIRNITQGADMLSTRVQVDAGETNSGTAATQPVIDTGNDDVAYMDQIAIDVDQDGTGVWGLGVILEFS